MDQLSLESLQALSQSDPASLDMALLAPLQKQLQAMQGENPEDEDVLRELENAVDTLAQEQIGRLNKLCDEVHTDFQKAVKAKRPIEDRWLDDERRFQGMPRCGDSKLYPNDAADSLTRSLAPLTTFATRSRVLMCWGRLADMMLPANDFPIRVDASDEPDPREFPSFQIPQAQPPQPGQAPALPPDPAALLSSFAAEKAGDMQQAIFKMLRDANFQAEARKALFDCARIGTGLIKGPFPELSQKRKFGSGGDFDMEEGHKAGITWVDPWKFYYDMTPTLARSSATYEVQILSRRELEDFKRYPRTLGSVIDELLEEKEPKLKGEFRTSVSRRNEFTDMKEPVDDVYAVLEAHKVLSKDDLREIMGIDWTHPELPLIHIWSCDGKCIKFKLTPLERDFRVDYYNMTILPADDTIFGYGYSYMCASAQRFLDGALNAIIANAAVSSVPLFIVAQGKVQPNRENWKIAGNANVWSVENGDAKVDDFLRVVLVDSNVQQNLELLKVGNDMMDQDTLFNQILQGNANGEEMPASGMVMSANIAGVFQKSIAAYADDNCFQPLGERLMWWQKMYDPKPIEGDPDVKAIAATQLVSKDLALQHTQVAIGLLANPQFGGFSDPYVQAESLVSNIDGLPNKEAWLHDRDTAMKNNAAIQQQAQQGDPNQAAKVASEEKIAMAKIQSAENIARAQIDKELQIEATRERIEAMKLNVAVVELANTKGLDIAAIQADLAKAKMADDKDRFKAVLDAHVSVGQQKMAEATKPSDPHSRFD